MKAAENDTRNVVPWVVQENTIMLLVPKIGQMSRDISGWPIGQWS